MKESMPKDYLNGLLYSMSNDLYPKNCLPFPVEKNALQKISIAIQYLGALSFSVDYPDVTHLSRSFLKEEVLYIDHIEKPFLTFLLHA